MGVIFPLSGLGRITLVLIAVVLGLIFWALAYPDSFRKIVLRKKDKKPLYKKIDKKGKE